MKTIIEEKVQKILIPGATDVICTHDAGGGEKVQTRHSIECVDGQWEGAEFNSQFLTIRGGIKGFGRCEEI